MNNVIDKQGLSELRYLHLSKCKVVSASSWKMITGHAVPGCYCIYDNTCSVHFSFAKVFVKYSFIPIGLMERYILKNVWNKARYYHQLCSWLLAKQ